MSESHDPIRIAFVCVQNAGRSQMATAFAEQETDERTLDVKILMGGTHPADEVHDVVVSAMGEVGIDISGRNPRKITTDELVSCDYVATMGCSTLDVSEAEGKVEVRDWNLDDPHGANVEETRRIRDEIRGRVRDLFDEIESERRV
ncbi:Protein-tyrosine-phosphatase [Haladaptatus litoreus]|uniref:Protein-tyrosine-phosphatase n=1 Tax=Haladaptatus litoreus TaxID=553468 RepID=A0A1N6YRW7_9EURY|nr:low molecular weight phosphatase family protein [Haladaptatus litoreus]SIR17350.1 Protein-tyrosine-phosphatase [Haladaptatus litoreus]